MLPSIFNDNLFDDFFNFPFYDDKAERRAEKKLYGHHAHNLMKTDIKEKKDGYELEMDLPGFKKDEISASLENGYLTISASKGLDKDEEKKDRLATVLYNLVEGITMGATLLESFMPETTERILAQLNAQKRTLEDLKTFGLYPSGNKVTEKPEILFARLDLKEVLAKVEELHPKKEEPVEEKKEENVIDIEAKPEITFDDFGKLQFQVGEIIACEEVKKSRKLLCSQVKIGSQVRQIVSGIKAHYSAEEMVGKKVMVVTNLKPAKLAGILSEGMILCAEDADGKLSLMVPEKEMPAGAEIC